MNKEVLFSTKSFRQRGSYVDRRTDRNLPVLAQAVKKFFLVQRCVHYLLCFYHHSAKNGKFLWKPVHVVTILSPIFFRKMFPRSQNWPMLPLKLLLYDMGLNFFEDVQHFETNGTTTTQKTHFHFTSTQRSFEKIGRCYDRKQAIFVNFSVLSFLLNILSYLPHMNINLGI
jgi:hypothetical protein